jgi:hypothetical protein
MKYKYIELCYYYAGWTHISIIKMLICVLSHYIIKYDVVLIFILRNLLLYVTL